MLDRDDKVVVTTGRKCPVLARAVVKRRFPSGCIRLLWQHTDEGGVETGCRVTLVFRYHRATSLLYRKKKPTNFDLVRLKAPRSHRSRAFHEIEQFQRNGGRQEVCNILLGGLVSISKTLRCHQHPGRAVTEPPLEVNVNLVTYHDISQLEKT